MIATSTKTEKAGAEAAPGAAEIEAQLYAIRSEVTALAAMVAAFGKDRAQAFRASAETMTSDTAEKVHKATDTLAHEAKRLEQALDTRLNEHPLQSMLMAFGFGFLASFLMRR